MSFLIYSLFETNKLQLASSFTHLQMILGNCVCKGISRLLFAKLEIFSLETIKFKFMSYIDKK